MANTTFTIDSRFNKDAQFKRVTFGADGKLVEAELNELQDIMNHRLARATNLLFGSRPLYVGSYTIASGRLNIANEYVVIDGEIIFIASTNLSVAIGDAIYLNKIESTMDFTSSIKKHGDLSSSTTVPNELFDSRIGEETTRRIQVTYQLTKTNTGGQGTFQKLCDIANNGAGQPSVKQLSFEDSALLAEARRVAREEASSAITTHAQDATVTTPYVVAGGSANTYTASVPGVTTLKKGIGVRLEINVANTGASTLNINGLGAKPIKKFNGADTPSGSLKANSVCTLIYNGTNFISQGEGGSGDASPANVLSGKTFSNDAGDQTGTMPNKGAVTLTPSTANVTIPAGYHNGSGVVVGSADLVSGNIKAGVTLFGVAGKSSVVDTSEATKPASSGDLLTGQIAYINGTKISGSMANRGAWEASPGATDVTIPAGYHNGSGKVLGDAKLIPSNIKAGVSIFGVTGTSTVTDTTETTKPALSGDIISGKIAYVNGSRVTGTMSNNGAWTASPGATDVTIPAGYHSGSGKVAGDAKLISANIKAGTSIFGVSGKAEVVDTSEGSKPALAGDLLSGKIAYVNGSKVTGTMSNNGTWNATPGTTDTTIPAGYHSGSGKVAGDARLLSANIRAGVSIFGVTGKSSVVDTFDDSTPAVAGDLLSGKVAYINGSKVTGSMKNNGTWNLTPGTTDVAVPAGYHNGSGKVAGDAKLISANIKAGTSIFGVSGSSTVVDTANATATASQLLQGQTAYVKGALVTGTIVSRSRGDIIPSEYTTQIAPGYYAQGFSVPGDFEFIPENIANDTTIWGVTGTLERVDPNNVSVVARAIDTLFKL